MSERITQPIPVIEDQLLRNLHPVKPNPEFINRLQNRLATPQTTVIEPPESTNVLWVLAGFILSLLILLIWLLRR